MNTWVKQIIAKGIGVAVFLTALVSPVLAVDMTVTCDETSCVSSPEGAAIFEEVNVLPGNSYTRILTAVNTADQALTFALEVTPGSFDDPSTPPLGKLLFLTISDDTDTVVYGPETLYQFNLDGYVTLGDIPAGGSKDYELTVVMPNVGNEYQLTEMMFDLNMGFGATAVLGDDTSGNDINRDPSQEVFSIPVPEPLQQILGASELPVTGYGLISVFVVGIGAILFGILLRQCIYSKQTKP